jgi:hypothetical protein
MIFNLKFWSYFVCKLFCLWMTINESNNQLFLKLFFNGMLRKEIIILNEICDFLFNIFVFIDHCFSK